MTVIGGPTSVSSPVPSLLGHFDDAIVVWLSTHMRWAAWQGELGTLEDRAPRDGDSLGTRRSSSHRRQARCRLTAKAIHGPVEHVDDVDGDLNHGRRHLADPPPRKGSSESRQRCVRMSFETIVALDGGRFAGITGVGAHLASAPGRSRAGPSGPRSKAGAAPADTADGAYSCA